MGRFEDLVAEGEAAPTGTWDFSWFAGRAVEERPSWHYFDRVVDRVEGVDVLLEVQAGTGSMVGNLPRLPRLAVATEGYGPSVAVAAPRLRARGVHLVVASQDGTGLPLAHGCVDLVTSRHPVTVGWGEIARVLRPGGTYLAQHVGPDSMRGLGELFTGPWPDRSARHPEVERAGAEAAGLEVRRMQVERPRTVFHDVGAVVAFLRLVPWIVPDFDVERHRERLLALHHDIERDGSWATTSCRVLVEARRPGGGET